MQKIFVFYQTEDNRISSDSIIDTDGSFSKGRIGNNAILHDPTWPGYDI